jgi:hypothetical protein
VKVAVLCESPADRAAIRILIDGVLQIKTREAPSLPHIETRPGGWPSVKTLLPAAIKYLHFSTDAEALVVIADSDDSPIHHSSHDRAENEEMECRLCQLRRVFKETKLRAVAGRNELKVAIGLAVPAIEAWYLCGVDPHVNEATWARKLQQGERITYTRNALKKSVYGAERPTIEIMKRHATEAAARLANDLSEIERLFPEGFGSFVKDVRSW